MRVTLWVVVVVVDFIKTERYATTQRDRHRNMLHDWPLSRYLPFDFASTIWRRDPTLNENQAVLCFPFLCHLTLTHIAIEDLR